MSEEELEAAERMLVKRWSIPRREARRLLEREVVAVAE